MDQFSGGRSQIWTDKTKKPSKIDGLWMLLDFIGY